ncbi:MAG: N-(5'-phosphoribosyl)anthranilate isomerase, partial [Candidatus Aminicenantes bacterium]
MTKIKICGLTNLEDALLAIECGADALGFIFSDSPRRITKEKAKKIIQEIPLFVLKIGVFMNEEPEWVREVAVELNLDYLQFHGQEDHDYLKQFGGKAYKAFRIKEYSDLNQVAISGHHFFLLDSAEKGKPFDWDMAIRAKQFGRFLLGGGLNPENIEGALKKVQPYGVDVCSGVELYPGKKDPQKLREFIRRIRQWDYPQANSVNLADVLSQ